jgi:hexosaminidase
VVYGTPISITDIPQYIWRGVMIDTSRHFLPVSTIKRAIDSLMYSKLNVLHWHITDEDAFPLYIPTLPELSQSGSIGGVYSELDVKSIISYGRARGIRVVPEIDTPAHSESWGRSEKYKYITLNCNGKYQGQLDPTLNLTWDVLTDVLKYVNSTFTDDYTHFGGDEVNYNCWGTRDKIVEWMKGNNIADFKALSIYFRQRQKKLWRTISPTKKVIYWAN